jgi:hypothetical protein
MLSLAVTDTREQTAHVFRALADRRRDEVDLSNERRCRIGSQRGSAAAYGEDKRNAVGRMDAEAFNLAAAAPGRAEPEVRRAAPDAEVAHLRQHQNAHVTRYEHDRTVIASCLDAITEEAGAAIGKLES